MKAHIVGFASVGLLCAGAVLTGGWLASSAPDQGAEKTVHAPVMAADPVDEAPSSRGVSAVASDSIASASATRMIGGTAAEVAQDRLGRQCEMWRGERIVHLPEDGQIYYLTVFTHDDWQRRAAERETLSWFTVHPDLAALRAQCHFRHLTPADPAFRLWADSVGGDFPCVALQHGGGAVQAPLYKASGSRDFPCSAGDLAAELLTVAGGCPCTPRPPEPPRLPPPLPFHHPTVPDVRPTLLSGLNEQLLTYALIAVIAIGALAFAGAFAVAWASAFKRKHHA